MNVRSWRKNVTPNTDKYAAENKKYVLKFIYFLEIVANS